MSMKFEIDAALLAHSAWRKRFSFGLGFVLGALAMLGDALSSFVKRRLNMASGSHVIHHQYRSQAHGRFMNVYDFWPGPTRPQSETCPEIS